MSMSQEELLLEHEETFERVYETYQGSRFLKRTLAPNEYKLKVNGDLHVPVRNKERLENEAACLRFIAERTDIPVPQVLGAYEKDGSYHLWTEYIQGVPLRDIREEEKQKVISQLEFHLRTLKSLRSTSTGGPTGLLCPQTLVDSSCDPSAAWKQITSTEEEFVFCHGDLSQSNIIVDPDTLNIVAIIDWEYGGWYPAGHDIPFYLRQMPSGGQARYFPDQVKNIHHFWQSSSQISE